MIRSVYYDQDEILTSIMQLCNIDRFDADVTYGNGRFYKNIPEPALKFDLDPQVDGVARCSSDCLPLPPDSLRSMVFDPPFLTYVKQAREHNSIMAKRFGGYWKYDELEAHYKGTISEAYRVLSVGGVLVFKCQDIVHNHRMHCTHINVVNWCGGMFRLKDLFILPAKHRIPIPSAKGAAVRKQKHARIFHSYFLVLTRI